MMKSWLGFGDLDLIFKVTAGLKLPNVGPKVLVCTISHELVGRFQPDLHGYNIGPCWRADLILVTMTYFSRSVRDLNCQIWAKRCLCAQYLLNWLAYLYPRQKCQGVYSFCLSVRSSVHMFVRSFVLPSRLWNYFKVLCASNSSGVYLTNHSSESIHIWTIGTLEGRLSFHDSSPQGPCTGWG